jgi:uncharacterized protein YbjT (DUF2867 family)
MAILVTGATGNVGRHVVRELLAAGQRVRALTRNPAAANLPDGVEVVRGDLGAPETLPFEGVDRMYLFPLAYRVAEPGSFAEVDHVTGVVDLAREAGVGRIVTLSSLDPGQFEVLEKEVEASGAEWTHVRPGEFAVNRLDMWGRSIRESGVVRTVYPDAFGTLTHEADIAAVCVAALLHDGHSGKRYQVTGPESLTQREQAAAIAAGAGREIEFVEVDHEEAVRELLRAGITRDAAEFLVGAFRDYGAQPHAITSTVEEVTGRPARTVARWAADHSADFHG